MQNKIKELCEENGINYDLVQKQNLNYTQVKEIILLHNNLDKLFKAIKNKEITNKEYVNKTIKEFEYELQSAWGFKRDKTRHSWWYRIPGCKCPVMDNKERFGIEEKIYNLECPWHGSK